CLVVLLSCRLFLMDTKIHSILSREILDSRGNPTIETTVILTSGYRGTASVPSGASVGKYEAVELRDGDEARFGGLGVTKAVANVTGPIAAKLRGMDASNQKALDDAMNTLDGTPNKANLGANSILSVSLASASAAATSQNIPLYRYINAIFSALHPVKLERIPTPLFNVINGGKHGAGNLDFQEFFLIPATGKRYHEGLQMGTELYHSLKKILAYRNAVHSVGDEGGFAPNLYTNMDAMEVLMEAIRATRYRFGVEVFFGLDVAATHFKTTRGYQIKDRASALSSREFINYLKDLHNKYRLLVLEDPIEEDDWGSWAAVTREIGNDVMIVGDDLLVTNKERLERAIAEKACNAILLKPNQIGTLTEFLQVVATAKKHDIKCIVQLPI
ncbi:MAG: Enolase, partial [Candidatus Gottesmanbacteria bacterium GW2011_GWA1_48_13]